MAKKIPTYTDAMILAMCDNQVYWNAQIRQAAKQRKVQCTSVTPIADVVTSLLANVGR